MKRFFTSLSVLALTISTMANCQQMNPGNTEIYEPEVPVVEPGSMTFERPADAIVLFDGSSLDQWETNNGNEVEWAVENGAFSVVGGAGNIYTKQEFGDVHLHVEWTAPTEISGEGQGRGNSGIFLQNRYEVQVLDNWNNPTYVNGMTGSIYKQHIPLANPAKQPGEWQVYDIFFRAPRFDDAGNLDTPARATVILNGVLVQNNVELYGPTTYTGFPEYEAHGMDRLQLQDHSNPVRYRNIWVKELNSDIADADGIDGDGN